VPIQKGCAKAHSRKGHNGSDAMTIVLNYQSQA
jgi:hypothetical protein